MPAAEVRRSGSPPAFSSSTCGRYRPSAWSHSKPQELRSTSWRSPERWKPPLGGWRLRSWRTRASGHVLNCLSYVPSCRSIDTPGVRIPKPVAAAHSAIDNVAASLHLLSLSCRCLMRLVVSLLSQKSPHRPVATRRVRLQGVQLVPRATRNDHEHVAAP
jgi:hypothetical protein